MNGTIPGLFLFHSRPVERSPSRLPSPTQSIPAGDPPGLLYLVATPIGNLEDITLRALRVLGEVTLIAAEDTRRTAKLLSHYRIHTKTTSFHGHNETRKGPSLLARLTRGDSVAIVTDAGTPLLSDPGARLVREALARGIQVQAVPGPSAALAGLVMSGLVGNSFTFVGFPPNRSHARTIWLKRLAPETRPVVLFEAPHRIRATLADMLAVLGDRDIAVCREITKVHEELVKGPISVVRERLHAPRGEFTIVVSPEDEKSKTSVEQVGNQQLWSEFCHLTEHEAFTRRAAIRSLAGKHDLSSRAVYEAIENEKA